MSNPATIAAPSLAVELIDVDEASLDECIDAIADLLIDAALAEPSLAPTN